MRQRVPVVMALVLCLTLVLCVGLFAQIKKDSKTGQDRIEGTIQSLDAAKSTLTLVQSGPAGGPSWHVAYSDKTQFTLRNKPGKAADLKEGKRVIVLGKYEKDVMTAARIDIRN